MLVLHTAENKPLQRTAAENATKGSFRMPQTATQRISCSRGMRMAEIAFPQEPKARDLVLSQTAEQPQRGGRAEIGLPPST